MEDGASSPDMLLSEEGEEPKLKPLEAIVKENPGMRLDSPVTPSTEPPSPEPPSPVPPSTAQASKGAAVKTSRVKPVTLCIFTMKEDTKCTMTFTTGKQTTVEQIFNETLSQLGMPSEAENVFSLWLTSKYLQLQLKPHHLPCMLFLRWKDLLSQYTNVSYDELSTDQPILSLQRNAFFNLKEERNLLKLESGKIIDFLFHEAMFNVTKSRYPMSKEELHELAGLQAVIQAYDSNDQNPRPSNYQKVISKYYPGHMSPEQPRRTKLFKQKSTEARETAEQFTKSMTAARAKSTDSYQLKILYLQICWHKSFYGSVFFRGQIKKPFKPVHLLTYTNQLLTVAVNADSFHLFSVDPNPETLLFLTLDQLTWELSDDEADDSCPSLWVEFDSILSEAGETRKVAKRIQIFSLQAPMMDAMIARCVAVINERERALRQLRVQQGNQEILPEVSIRTPCAPGESPRIQQQEQNYKENKLGCEVFTEDGSEARSTFTLSRVIKNRIPSLKRRQRSQEAAYVVNPLADESNLRPLKTDEVIKISRQDSNDSLTTGL